MSVENQTYKGSLLLRFKMSWRWVYSSLSSKFKRDIEQACTIVGNLPNRGPPPVVQTFYRIKRAREDWIVTPYWWSRKQWKNLSKSDKRALIKSNFPQKLPKGTKCSITLRDYQKEAMKEVNNHLQQHRTSLLSAYCGWGKTNATLEKIMDLGYVCGIITNSTIIREQWMGAIDTYYSLTEKAIKSGWKLYEKVTSKKITPKRIFYFINPIIVTKLAANCVDPLSHIGTVIIDECDTVVTQTMSQSMAFFTPRYMIGLSATPNRRDGLDGVLNVYLGPHRVVRENPKPLKVFRILTNFIPPKENKENGDLDWIYTENEQAIDYERNMLIANATMTMWVKYSLVTLVACRRVEQAKILYSIIKNALGESTVGKFIENIKIVPKTPIVIATSKKAGRGFDSTADALVWGYSSNSETEIIQVGGRVGRSQSCDWGIILDFVDINAYGKPDSLFERNWRTRGKWYRSRNGTKILFTDHTKYQHVFEENFKKV